MIEAGILDGDTVVIRRGEVAENGQIVVALVDESEVTLKRLRRRGNSIALEPCNVRHETRIFPGDRVKVQGRLVALLRRDSDEVRKGSHGGRGGIHGEPPRQQRLNALRAKRQISSSALSVTSSVNSV